MKNQACRPEVKRLLDAAKQAVETAIEHSENDGLAVLEDSTMLKQNDKLLE